ncbi:LysR family transcriptional regulator [Vibrio sp. RE86]|uniref:LysR family transcriptional regulator n=1 Tax=Vibrio sp. RE86 TaxID=2607605 RepID=UPI001493B176|nr:LysR family transcriptional regulator [Vibrio sp. RE86]NOH78369.1 LysR family transcriptional regulator [Vibrio sp. RE86]
MVSAKTDLLDGIVIFVEVVNSGSFTNAAQATLHSTSYISKEINKLESRLGVRLLQRTTRTLKLTPEGKEFYARCQQIIDDAVTAENLVSGSQREPQGTLRISCPVSFGLTKLQPVLVQFAQQFPKVQLDVDINDRMVDVIDEGFDIVIRASEAMDDSSLISRKLCSSFGVTVASPQYLKDYGTPSHPSELESHRVITYSLSKQPHKWVYQERNGEPIEVLTTARMITNSPQLELAMCKAGQGITRLPRDHINDEFEQGSLIELFPDFPPLQLPIYLVYPSKKHLSAKVRAFIDFAVTQITD